MGLAPRKSGTDRPIRDGGLRCCCSETPETAPGFSELGPFPRPPFLSFSFFFAEIRWRVYFFLSFGWWVFRGEEGGSRSGVHRHVFMARLLRSRTAIVGVPSFWTPVIKRARSPGEARPPVARVCLPGRCAHLRSLRADGWLAGSSPAGSSPLTHLPEARQRSRPRQARQRLGRGAGHLRTFYSSDATGPRTASSFRSKISRATHFRAGVSAVRKPSSRSRRTKTVLKCRSYICLYFLVFWYASTFLCVHSGYA